MNWQTDNSKTLHENHIQEFRSDTVTIPNGDTFDYGYVAKKFPTAVIIAENDQQQIALVNIYRYPNNTTIWQIPCENVESGEDDIHAAIRGCKEEIDLYPEKVEKIANFYIDPGTVKQDAKLYVATQFEKLKDEVHTDATEAAEISQIKWFSLEEIDEMILTNEIKDGWTMTAIGYYKAWKQHGQR